MAARAAMSAVAVTKFAADDQIRELLDLGHRDLGENRLQVMEAHAETVADWQERHALIGAGEETVRWHFIGGLQRNKIVGVPIVPADSFGRQPSLGRRD